MSLYKYCLIIVVRKMEFHGPNTLAMPLSETLLFLFSPKGNESPFSPCWFAFGNCHSGTVSVSFIGYSMVKSTSQSYVFRYLSIFVLLLFLLLSIVTYFENKLIVKAAIHRFPKWHAQQKTQQQQQK